MKKLTILAVLLFATPAFADYTIDLKNESGTVIRTYTVTTNQVAHLQKFATVTGKSVIDQVKEAVLDIITHAKFANKARWQEANDSYVDEQSRQ